MTIWDSSLHLWCFVARQNCLPQKAKSKGGTKPEIVTLATIILMTIQKSDICFDPSSDFVFCHNNCRNCSQNSWQTHKQYHLGWDPPWQNPAQHGGGWPPRRDAERETFILWSSVGLRAKSDGKFMRYWASRCPHIVGLPKLISYMDKSEAL